MCLLFVGVFNAQLDKNSALFLELKKEDSLFFERGFNQCDSSYLTQKVDNNLKFYHDTGGFQDRKEFLKRTQKYICGNLEEKPIRKVVANSLSVYPLYQNGALYGAIQSGDHQFYIRKKNEEDRLTGIAKFTSVWTKKDGQWLLSEVLSYDHKEAKSEIITDNWTDETILKLMKQHKIPTLGLAYIDDGKVVKSNVFGQANNPQNISKTAVFNVASLTKPITAMTVLKLVNEGKWNLDEPLYKYFTDPDIANDPRSKKLTTRMVLSHQSGFPNWRWIKENKKLSFDFDPGTKYQYSGEGFEYLRKAIENKFKKSLEELAKEQIFNPLKMNDTSYIWNEKNSDRIVIGYDKNGKPYDIVKNKTANAADDVDTTIENYSQFLIDIMNNKLLSPTLFDDMKTPQVATKNGKHFGLGFEIYNLQNDDIALSHGGADKGVQCIFFMLPKTKQALLIFTNVDDGYNIYEPLIKHYLGVAGQEIFSIETQ